MNEAPPLEDNSTFIVAGRLKDEGSIENGSVDVIFHASVHHNWMGPNVLTLRDSWH
jgi:hypothetical protein